MSAVTVEEAPESPFAYQLPEELPPPPASRLRTRFPVVALGLLSAVGLGFALFVLSRSPVGYVLVLYDIALGLGIGYAMALGSRVGRCAVDVRRLALWCALLAHAVFNAALWWDAVVDVAGTRPDLLGFLAYRAEHQTLLFGLQPAPWLNVAVWLGQIALTYAYASRLARETMERVQLSAVPAPVIEYVLYLLFQGCGTDEVEKRLARFGWTRPEDVIRALEAAGAAIDLMRASDTARALRSSSD